MMSGTETTTDALDNRTNPATTPRMIMGQCPPGIILDCYTAPPTTLDTTPPPSRQLTTYSKLLPTSPQRMDVTTTHRYRAGRAGNSDTWLVVLW
eukprot:5224440-Amphidinium_carterae.1